MRGPQPDATPSDDGRGSHHAQHRRAVDGLVTIGSVRRARNVDSTDVAGAGRPQGSGGAMAQELQRAIEALAKALDRSVAVDALDFRLIAFTSHVEPVDAVRQQAILNRQGPRTATTWVRKLGVARAEGPVRIPANDK